MMLLIVTPDPSSDSPWANEAARPSFPSNAKSWQDETQCPCLLCDVSRAEDGRIVQHGTERCRDCQRVAYSSRVASVRIRFCLRRLALVNFVQELLSRDPEDRKVCSRRNSKYYQWRQQHCFDHVAGNERV